MKDRRDLKLAVLIDADNIPYGYMKGMLDEVAKIGIPTIKRIYGDWTKPTIAGWKPVLLEHAITPIQQYSYTIGKNATDSAMIIDAMDILHDHAVDGFCLVSSDSDFTRLATRLRESGKQVIGIGEKKTPSPFIVACDKFIYIEIIGSQDKAGSSQLTEAKAQLGNVSSLSFESIDNETIKLLKKSVSDLADDNGWAFLGDVGNLIIKKKSDFDPRNYGYPKLTPLIKSLNKTFDIDERDVDGNNHIKHIYIRIKD
ncbi:MAG: NYN domain-containing protein [Dysgonomonas sp.]|nr:NYN domain-containing protein [Dysgonomonas sp.]